VSRAGILSVASSAGLRDTELQETGPGPAQELSVDVWTAQVVGRFSPALRGCPEAGKEAM
jgi:hypothetical protein